MLLQAQLPIIAKDQDGNPKIVGYQGDVVVVPAGQEQPYIDARFHVQALKVGLPNASKVKFPTPLRIAQSDAELEKFNVREAEQRARAAQRLSASQLNDYERLKREHAELQAQLDELQAENEKKAAAKKDARPKHFET